MGARKPKNSLQPVPFQRLTVYIPYRLNPSHRLWQKTKKYQKKLNRHGRIQNILATHGYENTDWFFNMVLCVFMVKKAKRS